MTDVSTTSTAEWWSYSESNGAFHSARLNSGWKFRKFYVPNGTAHSGCTHPTEPSACLFIVLVSRIQKSCTGNNNWDISVRPTKMTRFVKMDHPQSWSRTFRSDQTWLVNQVAMLLVISQLSRDVNLVPRSLVDEPNQEIWVQDYRYVIGFEDSWCHWCVLIRLLSQFNSRLLLGCPVILS